MNILFTAFSMNKGLGGHIRSMRQIMDEIGKTEKCYSIILGQPKKTPTNNNANELYIDVRNNNYFKIRNIIKEFIINNEIDLVHSFDQYSYILCQLGNNIPRLLTRCGGPNPKKYPTVKFLTCFSEENFNFFRAKQRYKNSNIFLIPNRIKKFECNVELIKDLELYIDKAPNDLILLRIARIGQHYIQSINQSINLLKKYQNENKDINRNIKLIILGAIYEDSIYKHLLKENKDVENLYFITTDKFTKEAKKIIDIADIIIGTGRGFMEAASKEKVLFAPEKGSKFPTLVDKSNFDNFFYHNFSERTESLPGVIVDFNLNKILDSSSAIFPMDLYDKYFNIENGVPHYLEIYKKVIKFGQQRRSLKTLIKYFFYCKYLILRYNIK
jgi:hypothetical protein